MVNLDDLSKEMLHREEIRRLLKYRYKDDKKLHPTQRKYFGMSYSDYLEELMISALLKGK